MELPRAAVRVEILEIPGKGEDAETASTGGNDSAPANKAAAEDASR